MDVSFTDQQLQAIRTTGSSVIVSAAAGSGKTAVLAERVAYLVCDAPREVRCGVDELLVLTFTDAAAAQMRSRIVDAIRSRLDERPGDQRLREQAALVDAAQISTIHSFCLWLVRRWFSHLGIDPAASVLGAEEESLLKGEVLDQLFSDLYAAGGSSDEPLGRLDEPADPGLKSTRRASPPASCAPGSESPRVSATAHLAREFVRLVDDYGLGRDRDIARLVRRLFDFVASLPEPEAWLRGACESLADRPECVVLATMADLAADLSRQVDHCERVAADIEAGDAVGHFYASQIRAYIEQLRNWASMLEDPHGVYTVKGVPDPYGVRIGDALGSYDRLTDKDRARALQRFDGVRRQIADFAFNRSRAPRLAGDVDPSVKTARDAARAQLKNIKERLFDKRLKKQFGLFSAQELIAGLKQTAPYVATIVELVLAFRDAYARRKRELNVLDFADLERFAFDLLRSEADPSQPSDVARMLHRRFAYVLIDEFQDINPLQQSIIRLASREADPDHDDNLFVVGDVKQSIYRFRLAEPAIFTERLNRFRSGTGNGAAVFLQRNFRSRPAVLDAVNTLFGQLTREGSGGMVYDKQAELLPGRDVDANIPDDRVELHLLERCWRGGGSQDEESLERGVADLSDPARWTPIEREAFVIGSRIRDWIGPSGSGPLRGNVGYGDIAVLLRATKINAERIAAILASMGIPAFADVAGSLFAAREVRDVVAALETLDNFQQDIPVAAVLRSGILSEPFSDDDLLEIRCLDRDIPFHAAVRRYVRCGVRADLRGRLRVLMDRIDRYRTDARRRPLADVLWRIYEEHGYLAYAGGLPNGAQRVTNLLRLHELARQFGSFRRQGLHRFLRFIRSLEDREQRVSSASPVGEGEDVVRIMSIHQAKGLEFPVVFVAGLGNKFNLGDRSGRMIFERTAGIGLRALNTERMIEYPTAAHRRVAAEIERTTREEELRLLYVAMTRARDKLVLVASVPDLDRLRGRDERGSPLRPASLLDLASAVTPLDWLLPVLRNTQGDCVHGSGDGGGARPLFDVHLHDTDEMAGWQVVERQNDQDRSLKRAAAGFKALPSDEPHAPHDPEVEEVLSRIDYVYPYMPSVSVRASIAAGEFEGVYDFMRNPEQIEPRPRDDDFSVPPSKYADATPDEAAHRGVITHRVLQHLDFATVAEPAGVNAELQRMVSEGLFSPLDAALVDVASIVWFLSTPLASAIREAGDGYRREFLYIAAEPLESFDRTIGESSGDYVLVRGMVDGILPVRDGIEIIDFKTDAIESRQVPKRAARYEPQVDMYARAMSRIWRRPVRTCWLVFLAARQCHAKRGRSALLSGEGRIRYPDSSE